MNRLLVDTHPPVDDPKRRCSSSLLPRPWGGRELTPQALILAFNYHAFERSDHACISIMPPPLPAESLEPRRSIRRAKPLSPESYDQIHDRGGAPDPSSNGFRTSFKRTFRDFKDRSTTALARSRSLSTQKVSIHASPEARLKGHSRSLTDVSAMVPIHAGSSPSEPTPVSPIRLRRPTLSIVPEGIPYQYSPAPAPGDIKTLQILRNGTLMTKVSAKKQKDCWFRLEADLGQIVWVSKAQKISEFSLWTARSLH